MATLYFQKEKIADVTYEKLTPDIAETKYSAQVLQFATDRFIEILLDKELPALGNAYRLQDGEISLLINPVYKTGEKSYLATYEE